MGCDSRQRARAKPLAGRYITYSKFKGANTVKRSSSEVRTVFWCMAIFVGALQAWSSRVTVDNMDIIPIVDMANYMLTGDWSMIPNGTSNPLLACLIALTFVILQPSIYWQYPAMHLLLFLIFVFCVWCFDFFLRQMILLHRQQNPADPLYVPDWMLLTVGYTLFLWSSLALIRVSLTEPDMLLVAFFYLAAGLLLRIRRGRVGWTTYLALGAVLGLGYLTKSIMFPVALLCLGVAALMGSRRETVYAIGATLVFAAFSTPYLVALCMKFGEPTFGGSGKFNALLDINHLPTSFLWRGYDGPYGTLLHPVHQIVDRPATFEFASPVGGSYPLRYDFTYWIAGLRPQYQPVQMAKNLTHNLAGSARWWALGLNGSILAGLVVLFWVSGRRLLILRDVAAFGFLLIPSLIPLGMYGVLHIEPRFIGGFLTVAYTCLFFSVKLPPTLKARRLFSGVALLLLLMFVFRFGPDRVLTLANFSSERNLNAEIVEALYAMGLRPGDAIASLELGGIPSSAEPTKPSSIIPDLTAGLTALPNPGNEGFAGPAFWASLGQFRLVAEVFFVPKSHTPDLMSFRREFQNNDFWDADIEQQEKVLNAFAKTGARLVVSIQAPRGPGAASWRRIGDTNTYVCWLEPVAGACHDG
jgi:hypothetical protein